MFTPLPLPATFYPVRSASFRKIDCREKKRGREKTKVYIKRWQFAGESLSFQVYRFSPLPGLETRHDVQRVQRQPTQEVESVSRPLKSRQYRSAPAPQDSSMDATVSATPRQRKTMTRKGDHQVGCTRVNILPPTRELLSTSNWDDKGANAPGRDNNVRECANTNKTLRYIHTTYRHLPSNAVKKCTPGGTVRSPNAFQAQGKTRNSSSPPTLTCMAAKTKTPMKRKCASLNRL